LRPGTSKELNLRRPLDIESVTPVPEFATGGRMLCLLFARPGRVTKGSRERKKTEEYFPESKGGKNK
jgi:hypothetical protein